MGRFLALILVAVIVAGCGGGRTSPSHVRRRPPTPQTRQTRQTPLGGSGRSAPCITQRGFGGLGASVKLFDANNNDTTGEAGPTPGAAFYQVIGVLGGCVTAYAVWDQAGPPLKASDLINLLSPYLPRDARELVETGGCAVWRSRSLLRATGLLYAKAIAIPQIGTRRSGKGEMTATFASTC